jgi:hypothetical protein
MAQANQLPAAASALPSKAPGWDRVLGEGIDKPGSLAEKAEAAFKDAGLSSLVVKTASNLQSVDETREQEGGNVIPPYSPSSLAIDRSISKPKPLTPTRTIEEFELSDCLDIEQPSFDLRGPRLMQQQGDVSDRDAPRDPGKGWNMQGLSQDAATPMSVGGGMAGGIPTQSPIGMNNGPEPTAGSRRWYKPSTWNRASASKAPGANNAVASMNEVPTPMSSFDTNIQRMGVTTPDSDGQDSPPMFSGASGPGRRRPRRDPPHGGLMSLDQSEPQIAAVECGFMECPGAIIDAPTAVVTAPVAKAQSNPKHHSGGVERAAFPSEERALQRAREEAERASAARGRLGELEDQKKAAIGREDFMEAQRIKGEIEAFKAQAKAPAPANQVSQPSTQQPAQQGVDRSNNSPSRQDGGWNAQSQAEEPSRVSPSPAEEPVRKRFWKPWAGPKPAAAPASAAPTEAETVISAFDSS